MLVGLLLSGQEFQTTTALFGDLRARQIGPAAMSGRISCLTADPNDANIVYIGAGGRRRMENDRRRQQLTSDL